MADTRGHEPSPLYTDVSTRVWRAMADPVRIRIVAALRGGPLTPDSLAGHLGIGRAAMASHARALETAGFVRAARNGETVRFYELATGPRFSDEAWEALPLPVRRAAAAAALVEMNATALASVDTGGFDRPDMHLTRTSLMLDEIGWRRLSERLLELLRSFDPEQAEAARRLEAGGHDPVDATALLMLFTTRERPGDCDDDPHDGPPAPEDELELHERAYDLAADVDRAIAARRVDWQQVVGLADQLRLVARAADTAQRAAEERAARRAKER